MDLLLPSVAVTAPQETLRSDMLEALSLEAGGLQVRGDRIPGLEAQSLINRVSLPIIQLDCSFAVHHYFQMVIPV